MLERLVPALIVATCIASAADAWAGANRTEQAQSASPMRTFALSIDGTAGVTVVAACLVNTGDDIEVVTLKGAVPQTREFLASGISCQIQKRGRSGRLDVQIKKDGRTVSRSQSSGPSGVISISVQ
jgi:hypothetical protein